MTTSTFSIPGIHCDGCARLIKDVSADVPGVSRVDIDLATKRVTIEHGEAFNMEQWKTEIEALNPKYVVQPTP